MTLPTSENTPQISESLAGPSPLTCQGFLSHQTTGQNGTQWELEKCREMLRVQFNLNSIYKKEVGYQ